MADTNTTTFGAGNCVVADQDGDTLDDIRHRIEGETAKLDSLQKMLWYFAHAMGDQDESPMFFAIGNSIEAIKGAIDAALQDLTRLEVQP